jgi:hypothetical protein
MTSGKVFVPDELHCPSPASLAARSLSLSSARLTAGGYGELVWRLEGTHARLFKSRNAGRLSFAAGEARNALACVAG